MTDEDRLDAILAAALGGQAPAVEAPRVLDASGQPARRPGARLCPRCGAGPEHRRRSSGFGAFHDVCGTCGQAFDERTV